MSTTPTGGNPGPTPYNFPPEIKDQVKVNNNLQVEENPGHLLTLSQTLKLNGQEYTVRLYIKKIPGKTYDQIKADPQVIQRMNNTITKLVDLAVIFNVGKDKGEKGVVTGITLSNNDQTIAQHLDKGKSKEKKLSETLDRKVTRLSERKDKITSTRLAVANDTNPDLIKLTQRLSAIVHLSTVPSTIPNPSDEVDDEGGANFNIHNLSSDDEAEDEEVKADPDGGKKVKPDPNLHRKVPPSSLAFEQIEEDEK